MLYSIIALILTLWQNGMTALMIASMRNQITNTELLLQAGASPESKAKVVFNAVHLFLILHPLHSNLIIVL
jgi:ankyrin repeat protein